MLKTDTNRLVAEVQALRQRVIELEKSQLECEWIEKKLKESEARYKTIFESANDALILLDKKGEILDFNKKLTDVSGYNKEELIGKRITFLTKIMPKKSLAIVTKNLIKRIMGIEIPPYEVEMIMKSGELKNVEINAVAVKKDDRIVGDLAILRDITERKHVEKILQDSEEKHRIIFEQAADSIVLIDAKTGALVEFNNRAYENLGYSREEFGRLNIADFEVIESSEEVTKHLEKIVKKGTDYFETQHRTKNGEIRDIQVSSRSILIGGRTILLSIWRDVTKQKLAEERILRLASAVWMSTNIIIITDLDAKIVDINEATMKMYGTDNREDLIGKNLLALIVPTRREAVLEDIREVWKKGYSEGREYLFVSNGYKVPVEMRSCLVKSTDGKPVGFVRIGLVSKKNIS
jgi:PAS domain S-box-containing protein